MSERLRLALEQATDAENEAHKLRASARPRAEAVYAGRFITRDAFKRLRASVMKNTDLILDNARSVGIAAFGQRIHATLTELAEEADDDLPNLEGNSYEK
jgi:hypothetical protein